MDKFIKKHSGKLKYLFLLGATIAAFNTLSRADYNFVLYLYMFYVWTFLGNSTEFQAEDKIGTFYILLYSLFIDIFWCLFWGGKWDNISTLMHEFTLFFSWIGIVVKFALIIIVGILEWDIIKVSFIRLLKQKSSKGQFDPFEDEQ